MRRLLIGGSGGAGSSPSGTAPAAFAILTTGGAWPTWNHAFWNSVTDSALFGFVTNGGSVRTGEYDGAGSSTQVGVLSADQHNAPAIIRRISDGRYVAAMCDHSGPAMYINISTNPDDNSVWAGTTNIDSQLGGEAYTYPFLCQLEDEIDDPIYLGFRVQDVAGNNWCLSKSTNGGVGWTILTNITFGTRYYGRFAKSSGSRIDFAVTNGSYAEDFASLYHAYYEGGSWHKTDGTVLAGSPPFAITDFTLVYNGATAGVRIPNSIARVGSEIVITFPVQTGTPSGHIGTDGDYKYARWDGSSWSVHTLAAAVGMTTFDFTEGGLSVDPSDLDHVAASIRVSGTWRMHDCLTSDGGATWMNTQITFSGGEDRYPWFVLDHQATLQYIWQKGTFTSETVFSVDIWGRGVV